MKHSLTTLLMAVGITAGPLVSHLTAQTNREVAEIPFAFVVANQTLPAGHYVVDELTSGSPVFKLTDSRNHAILASFMSNGEGNPNHPSLTFVCYGKECILAKVTPPDSPSAYALSRQATEKYTSHKLGVVSMISVRLTAR